jgi:hypothetical protein
MFDEMTDFEPPLEDSRQSVGNFRGESIEGDNDMPKNQ